MSAQNFIKDLKGYLVDCTLSDVDERKITNLFKKWCIKDEIIVYKEVEKKVFVYLENGVIVNSSVRKKPIDEEIDLVIKDACRLFSCPLEVAMSNTRKTKATYPRYFVFRLMKDMGYTLKEIARKFNKDHTTVINGLKKAQCFIDTKAEPFYSIWVEYKK